jgi:hypothetical protein
MVALLSANDQRDSRKVNRGRVMRQEFGERPGGQSGRANGVRVTGCAERERDRQLVGTDRLRVMPVIPAAEVNTEAVVDDLAQLLEGVKDLPWRVSALAGQCNARAVPRPSGLRR